MVISTDGWIPRKYYIYSFNDCNEITIYFHLSRSFDRKQQLQAPAPRLQKKSLKIEFQLHIRTVYRNLLLNKNIILICNTISCQQYCRSVFIKYTIQLLRESSIPTRLQQPELIRKRKHIVTCKMKNENLTSVVWVNHNSNWNWEV